MFNIAVCDNEPLICTQIEDCLIRCMKKSFMKLYIEVFGSGEELLYDIQNGYKFDIIFLGIEFETGNMNGIDIGKALRRQLGCENVQIIYISAYTKYAIESFQNMPLDFLIKPISEDAIMHTLEVGMKYLGLRGKMFSFKRGREERKIVLHSILYFEGSGKKIQIVTKDETLGFNGSLQKIYERELQSQRFIFCHQSFIVNYYYVKEFGFSELKMSDGRVIPISKYRRKEVELQQQKYEKEDLME